MTPRKTVLLVEDHEDTRLVLSAVLNHDGYSVLEAHDGAEGLDLARRHLPDLVLMDIHMPGMSGFEAAEALRDDSRTRAIPVVAVTADRFFGDRQRRAEALFHSCLWKPIAPTDLMDHLRTIIGGP